MLTLCLITGCTNAGPIKSFEGYFHTVEASNTLRIDCSSAVQENDPYDTDIGYMCKVEVTENTIIETEDGKKLNVNDLAELDVEKTNTPKGVKVDLAEEQDINTSSSSREGLKASKIVISN
ncbi:hypothetical protein DYE48_12180 [Halobacillus trueperi]|uniref:Uncharacterized protein n=1 Tax=Halobacillus trueperi TaxID=156205 RepID=A0A3E0J7C5_9BACI|nr:hypothetical protein DYE48_12180 [Halobacillus trueperi]